MNFSHLKTIMWLRWRLFVNQFRKIGRGHKIFSIVILIGAFLSAIFMCWAGWSIELSILKAAPASMYLLIWAGIVVTYLFTWSIGVLTELQRKEPLTLSKFLHLPVSPANAFVNNFVSSFISISTIFIFPIMLGFTFRMIAMFGPRLIPGLFLLLAFVFMVMALTYQFRGWLAALMVDKRRRRAIITGLTLVIVVVSQIPNVIGITFDDSEAEDSREKIELATRNKLNEQLEKQEITAEEFTAKIAKIEVDKKRRRDNTTQQIAEYVRIACVVIPFGWLAIGMESLVDGQGIVGIAVPLLCLVGLTGVTFISLRRSYGTTLRMYRGEIVDSPNYKHAQAKTDEHKPTWVSRLVEKKLPLLSNHQSAIASTTMISVIRAPEAKMALLTPFLIMLFIGVSFAFRDGNEMPVSFRAFTGIGVATFAMFGIMQLINNQFGYDRDGFRCMVLSPVRRLDILIGKNMAYAPFAVGIGAIGIVAMQLFIPMPWTHFLATLVQLGTVYLITCMVANLMSIKAPLAVASGTMKPTNMNLSIVVLQLLITLLLPICLLPTMIPPGIELIVNEVFDIQGIPIYLILSFVLFAVTVVVYRIVVARQAEMLRQRETEILETVTHVGA